MATRRMTVVDAVVGLGFVVLVALPVAQHAAGAVVGHVGSAAYWGVGAVVAFVVTMAAGVVGRGDGGAG